MSLIDGRKLADAVKAHAGDTLVIDNWQGPVKLEPETWERADFRVTSPRYPEASAAIRIEVTGNKVRYGSGTPFSGAVRVRVIFVGDGEPDVHTGGWLKWNEVAR